MHGEQAATARRVQDAGLGAWLQPKDVPLTQRLALGRLLADTVLADRAQAFAAARGAVLTGDAVLAAATRCEQLAGAT